MKCKIFTVELPNKGCFGTGPFCQPQLIMHHIDCTLNFIIPL